MPNVPVLLTEMLAWLVVTKPNVAELAAMVELAGKPYPSISIEVGDAPKKPNEVPDVCVA